MTGTVKWFSAGKGYGFLTADEGGEDIFVHFSVIKVDGYKKLADGQRVSFELDQNTTGKLRASSVTPLTE